jgi:hypothetical protein
VAAEVDDRAVKLGELAAHVVDGRGERRAQVEGVAPARGRLLLIDGAVFLVQREPGRA